MAWGVAGLTALFAFSLSVYLSEFSGLFEQMAPTLPLGT